MPPRRQRVRAVPPHLDECAHVWVGQQARASQESLGRRDVSRSSLELIPQVHLRAELLELLGLDAHLRAGSESLALHIQRALSRACTQIDLLDHDLFRAEVHAKRRKVHVLRERETLWSKSRFLVGIDVIRALHQHVSGPREPGVDDVLQRDRDLALRTKWELQDVSLFVEQRLGRPGFIRALLDVVLLEHEHRLAAARIARE
jgi:hypothetical protein